MNPCNDESYEKFRAFIGEENAKRVYEYLKKCDFVFTGKGYVSSYERSKSKLSIIEGVEPKKLEHRSRSWGHTFRRKNKKDVFGIRRNSDAAPVH